MVTSIKLLEHHQIIYGSTYKDGLGWCSDSLRAGRFAFRTLVRGAIFRAPVQTAPGTHPVSVQWLLGYFPGVKQLERDADRAVSVCASGGLLF
jgi:hypothetical protein